MHPRCGRSPSRSPTAPSGRSRPASTPADVAAAISKSLEKAALAARRRRPALRPVAAARAGRHGRHRHRQGRGRARADPPRLRPHHGPRRAGALARRQGDDRPGDRERLVLRLRPRRALHPRRPRPDRGADARDHRRPRPGALGGLGPRPRDPPLRGDERALQGRARRGDPGRRPDPDVLARPLAGPLPRPAPRQHRPGAARRLQADLDRRRLLARRLAPPDAAAHLRRRLPHQGRPRRLPAPARGGGEARPPQARPRDGPLPPAAGGAGLGLLAPERLHALAHPRGLHPPPARRRRLRRGEDPAAARLEALAAVRPLGQVPREHVRRPRRDPLGRGRGGRPGALRQGRPAGAEADELPGAHPDLQPGHQVLPRPADPHGRVRLLPPQRGARRAARADARAADDPGRRPHLLPRGPDHRRDPALPRALRAGLRRHGPDRHRLQARDPPRRPRRRRRHLGPRRGGARRRAARRRPRRSTTPPARAPSTARSSSST